MDPKEHWERVYRANGPDEVSWFEPEATLSLELITRAAPALDAAIIDVGAGASTLVDGLLEAGYKRLTLLDISSAALAQAKKRLSMTEESVAWRVADVLETEFDAGTFDVWHDRAVFHFLTDAADRTRYVKQVRHAVRPGGHVLVATFAEDGPTRCSGLNVSRYSAYVLHSEFGEDFRFLESRRKEHTTPSGSQQPFTYCLCRYEPHASSRHAA